MGQEHFRPVILSAYDLGYFVETDAPGVHQDFAGYPADLLLIQTFKRLQDRLKEGLRLDIGLFSDVSCLVFLGEHVKNALHASSTL